MSDHTQEREPIFHTETERADWLFGRLRETEHRLEAAERGNRFRESVAEAERERADLAEAEVARLTARLEEVEGIVAEYVERFGTLAASPGESETLPGGDLGGPRPAGVRRCQADNPHEPHDHFPDGAVRYRCPGEPETQEPPGSIFDLGPPLGTCTCPSHGLTEHYRHALDCPLSHVSDDETATAALLLSIGRIASEEGEQEFLDLVLASFEQRGYTEAWVQSRGPSALKRTLPAAWPEFALPAEEPAS